MGNNGSTILRAADKIKNGKLAWTTVEFISGTAVTWYFVLRRDEVKNSLERGEEIVILGKKKAKQKVLEYFMPLDDQDSISPDFIEKTKKYFDFFKLTVTSIEGFKDGMNKYDHLERPTLLICHPRTDSDFHDEYKMLINFLHLKNVNIENRYIVLTGCVSHYENYNNCSIPLEIQSECKENPIMFRDDGKAFGYRLFYLKFPRSLIKDVSTDIVQAILLLLTKVPRVVMFLVKKVGPELMVVYRRYLG